MIHRQVSNNNLIHKFSSSYSSLFFHSLYICIETDGPPGAVALAYAAIQLGHRVKIVTDKCNGIVFRAAIDDNDILESYQKKGKLALEIFTPEDDDNDRRLRELAKSCNLILSCERAGPAEDGNCYTMRSINMTEKGLIAPIHKLIEYSSDEGCKFIAIGDGGNELGMGKVLDQIKKYIPGGSNIGCSISADCLIASSVSNWGGYALAAGAAIMRAVNSEEEFTQKSVKEWVTKCLPTEEQEISLLKRCVDKGCRDGVSGKVEATVDGMPLERSLQCLRDIRNIYKQARNNK